MIWSTRALDDHASRIGGVHHVHHRTPAAPSLTQAQTRPGAQAEAQRTHGVVASLTAATGGGEGVHVERNHLIVAASRLAVSVKAAGSHHEAAQRRMLLLTALKSLLCRIRHLTAASARQALDHLKQAGLACAGVLHHGHRR